MKRFVTVALIVSGLLIPGMRMVSAVQVHDAPTAIYVVKPGDNLWTISGKLAPGMDRRDTVARLVELNDLGPTGLIPGQPLRVPAP